jgi:16S rRNA (cytosine1402-N4)-methyltransferase
MTHFAPLPPDPAGAQHWPVMVAEVVEGLALQPGQWVIDATVGGGGHTTALLAATAPDGKVLGIDADPAAIRRVQTRLAEALAEGRLQLAQANFDQLETVARQHQFTVVDAILLDLGVSSFQLETAARGFSFQADGPLDMRFDPSQLTSAADIVNFWPEAALADLLYRYGEERQSRRIARHLVQHRPFSTTGELASAIAQAVGAARRSQHTSRIHPATRSFQALRIVVNRELEQLSMALPQALRLLRPGGRLAVISFHSLEDRIVKQWMQQEAAASIPDPASRTGRRPRSPTLELVTGKPLTAADEEVQRNPRSRSAKLRIIKKIDSPIE